MNTKNRDIRLAAGGAGIKQWQIAEKLGIQDTTLSKKLRKELPQEEKEKIIGIIAELAKGGRIMSIPRMRTIPECVAMLKELDPDTAITLTALRNMVKRGKIPTVPVGSKQLINFDMLLEMFCLNQPAPAPSSNEYGKIRPISENLHRFG